MVRINGAYGQPMARAMQSRRAGGAQGGYNPYSMNGSIMGNQFNGMPSTKEAREMNFWNKVNEKYAQRMAQKAQKDNINSCASQLTNNRNLTAEQGADGTMIYKDAQGNVAGEVKYNEQGQIVDIKMYSNNGTIQYSDYDGDGVIDYKSPNAPKYGTTDTTSSKTKKRWY